ncbi:MAG: HD domain-containing protein [Candidatus Syntrophonatronum acetioxidans]|uniref:bis(5'-nucleosyl)-tetraphosphatase (symmetrical) n=1 Tax=Candidatus Syntrophonatronum acetioxidans TaxID=1795816 RepID=A0A424YG29_9FIRM|nr:MAG: HD domain-containing protein [Candidatus Syntrophonatronum acetioxidans]
MELKDLEKILKSVLSRERYIHSLGVKKVSRELAIHYGEEEGKGEIAGLLHDYGKKHSPEELLKIAGEMKIKISQIEKESPDLLHGPLGALLVKKDLGIDDKDILEAIRYHTTGKASLGKLAALVFLADYIEENRSYPGVEEIRELAFQDLEKALLRALDQTIRYVLDRGMLLHPDSVNFRNHILLERKKILNKGS